VVFDGSLSYEQHKQLGLFQEKLAQIQLPREPPTAEQIFENKMFNQVKQKMPHLPSV
jgi:hypothetical protein